VGVLPKLFRLNSTNVLTDSVHISVWESYQTFSGCRWGCSSPTRLRHRISIFTCDNVSTVIVTFHQHYRLPNATKSFASALLHSCQRVNTSPTAIFTPDRGKTDSTCSCLTSAAFAIVTRTFERRPTRSSSACLRGPTEAVTPTQLDATLSFEAQRRARVTMVFGGPIMGGRRPRARSLESCDTKEPTRHPNRDNAGPTLSLQSPCPLFSTFRVAARAGHRLRDVL
jgi:hypothetical protein